MESSAQAQCEESDADALWEQCAQLEYELAEANDLIAELRKKLDEYESVMASVKGHRGPQHHFVLDGGSPEAHHWDYIDEKADTALCGHEYETRIIWEGDERPIRVCKECEARLPSYEVIWWREAAREAELSRRKFQRSADRAGNLIRKLQDQLDAANQVRANIPETGSLKNNSGIHDPLLDLLGD